MPVTVRPSHRAQSKLKSMLSSPECEHCMAFYLQLTAWLLQPLECLVKCFLGSSLVKRLLMLAAISGYGMVWVTLENQRWPLQGPEDFMYRSHLETSTSTKIIQIEQARGHLELQSRSKACASVCQ